MTSQSQSLMASIDQQPFGVNPPSDANFTFIDGLKKCYDPSRVLFNPSFPPISSNTTTTTTTTSCNSSSSTSSTSSSSSSSSSTRCFPIPTNKWWCNWLQWHSKSMIFPASAPIWSQPYMLRLCLFKNLHDRKTFDSLQGVGVGYPMPSRRFGPKNERGALESYSHSKQVQVVMSALEFSKEKELPWRLHDWDDLGVHLSFALQDVNDSARRSCMTSYLALGMAFVSMTYTNLHPSLWFHQSIQDWQVMHSVEMGFQRLRVTLQDTSTWLVYVYASNNGRPCPQAMQWTSTPTGGLTSQTPLNGTIRLTRLMNKQVFSLYDESSRMLPVGCKVECNSEKEYGFRWQLLDLSSDTQQRVVKFVHFGLEHHQETIQLWNEATQESLERLDVGMHSTTKGSMAAIVASLTRPHHLDVTWRFQLKEELPAMHFYPTRLPTPERMSALNMMHVLRKDIDLEKRSVHDESSYYFMGKRVLKLANLCLLARLPCIVGSNDELFIDAMALLRRSMEALVNNQGKFPLCYDTVYGGIISNQGILRDDMHLDFGNTVYNDHHYHYGYWIAAAAIAWYLDPAWAQALPRFQQTIECLLRDVSNPSTLDTYFPRFRCFEWFMAHSYSRGIVTSLEGKDEESVSEELNFYYGMYLWSLVTKKESMGVLARLMMALNASAAKKYFLLQSHCTSHPPDFVRNKVTGIAFENAIRYGTWFSSKPECIHGIQMLPVSPVLHFLRSKEFVREEWDEILSQLDVVRSNKMRSPWESILFSNLAIIDSTSAIARLLTCPMDDGLARSWALFSACCHAE